MRAIGLMLFVLAAVALSLSRRDAAPVGRESEPAPESLERSLAAYSELESIGVVAYDGARTVVGANDLLGRVRVRLLYDQDLVGAALTLSQKPGGVVVVEGAVVSEDARRRAVELARGTVGVVGILSHIDVVRNLSPSPAVVAIGRPVAARRRVLAEVAASRQASAIPGAPHAGTSTP